MRFDIMCTRSMLYVSFKRGSLLKTTFPETEPNRKIPSCRRPKSDKLPAMGFRLLDIFIATIALVLSAPVMLCAAIGIRLASPGPVIYRAQRAGRHGVPFTMHKFRTMHVDADRGAAITAARDNRIFPLGAALRATKIDELPQFFDVLRGKMAICGPRPEDPRIVARDYTSAWMHETLSVRPGITSPGALWGYAGMDAILAGAQDVEAVYARDVLPYKLALELVYVRNRTVIYDLALMLRTAVMIVRLLQGKANPHQPEDARIPHETGVTPRYSRQIP